MFFKPVKGNAKMLKTSKSSMFPFPLFLLNLPIVGPLKLLVTKYFPWFHFLWNLYDSSSDASSEKRRIVWAIKL